MVWQKEQRDGRESRKKPRLAARKLMKYRKYTRAGYRPRERYGDGRGGEVVVVEGEEIRRRYQRDGIVQVT